MIKKCFVFALCVVSLAACKKNTPFEPHEDVQCNSVTTIGNDTATVALLTEYTSQHTNIVKLENGITSTVASATNYEFWGPAISPDKQKFICFRSTTIGNTVKVNDYEHAELWMFDMDGSNGHMILNRTTNSWSAMGMADWAPDGMHIVLSAEKTDVSDGNKHWNIYLTDTIGSTPVKMNTRVGRFTHPHFANGNMNLITYSALPDGLTGQLSEFGNEIYFASVTGAFLLSGETQITNDDRYDYEPVFSPDNSKICFTKTTTNVNMSGRKLFVYNMGSGLVSPIASENGIDENARWCAANDKIYSISQSSGTCLGHVMRFDFAAGQNRVYFRVLNKFYSHIDIK